MPREALLHVLERTRPEVWDEGLAWYKEAKQWAMGLAQVYGKTLEQVAGVTAALSPLVEWEENKRRAEMVVGGGWPKGLQVPARQANRIYLGESVHKVLRGPKVRAFFFAIRDAEEYNEAVIDRHAFSAWLGRVAMDSERRLLTKRKIVVVQRDYAELASEVGVRPHELQAVVWTQWRREKHG